MSAMIRISIYMAASTVIALTLLIACGSDADNIAPPAVPSEDHANAASASPVATSHEHARPTAAATPATQVVASATSTATATAFATEDATPAGHEHVTPVNTAIPATQDSASATANPGSEASQIVVVQILDFAFDPPLLEIEPNTTVTFINQGVDHTATSIGEPRLFDSGIMKTGDRFTFTFDAPGTFDYWCLLHPNMLGTIVVK